MEAWISDIIANGSALFASLGISAASVVALLLVYIKYKVKSFGSEARIEALNKAHDAATAELEKKYDKKLDEYQSKMVQHLDNMENSVNKKIGSNEEERAAKIEASTLNLQKLLDAAKEATKTEEE